MQEEKKSALESSRFAGFELISFANSNFIRPYRLKFTQNEHQRIWDGIRAHASVSCLIYNKDKKCIILVRQFRPVVYVSRILEEQENAADLSHQLKSVEELDWSLVDPKEGITSELCAGICDKSKPLEEIVREEIMEECGYDVDIEHIHKIVDSRLGVGLLGCLHTIFYAEVTNDMKKSEGGGNSLEGEFIELYELDETKVREFVFDPSEPKPPGLLFALIWFLYERDKFMAEKTAATGR